MIVVKKTKKIRSLSLRIADSTMSKVDEIAKKHSISRQKLIEKILETAMSDEKFEIEISTEEEV